MRVATLNTWGPRGDWDSRRASMRRELARIDADVLTLQETVLTDDLDQVEQILPAGYHVAQQTDRESGGRGVPPGQGISTASRWPFGEVIELDLHVTDRTGDFACAALVTEILAPQPLGRLWVANHFPDYQLDHERERVLQGAVVAEALERLVEEKPGHVIVAGDMDADPWSDSLRFWTGRHVVGELSVCYRSAVEAVHGLRPAETYLPQNPFQADPDWPFRAIDHVLVRCGAAGPTLLARSCRRAFDTGPSTVSDHYGLVVDYEAAPATAPLDH
ncbi:hypothetical protein DEO23_00310 [Brachybacterium endophyticum]|uniref:Endonuclease/exonuclease/phosphatase domain-containing protein n=1 Tax=Brachybacterium endophyticum TaxID=2182385 RepID=A0A2U2RMS4_9MICO|nr:endonuclease/exonuclease/phosphatase family protein [Brachybacterium endophyticum]PWH07146.1 hypothetical protein DEO23_00310 [Brachybacterium endophyticum]